jgi:hypothetical protein
VLRGDNDVALPKLSFDLLMALIEAAPRIVTTDELMDRVWTGLVVSPETVSQRVSLLRAALGDNSKDPHYVAVVRWPRIPDRRGNLAGGSALTGCDGWTRGAGDVGRDYARQRNRAGQAPFRQLQLPPRFSVFFCSARSRSICLRLCRGAPPVCPRLP